MNYWTEIWMNFAHHIKNNYCSFKGGETRRDYWTFVLSVVLCAIGVQILDALIGLNVFSCLFSIFIFLPALGAQVRRLHDRGASVWFLICEYIALGLALFFALVLALQSYFFFNIYPSSGYFANTMSLLMIILLFLLTSLAFDITVLVFTIQKGKGEYKNIVYRIKNITYEIKNEETDSSSDTGNDKKTKDKKNSK